LTGFGSHQHLVFDDEDGAIDLLLLGKIAVPLVDRPWGTPRPTQNWGANALDWNVVPQLHILFGKDIAWRVSAVSVQPLLKSSEVISMPRDETSVRLVTEQRLIEYPRALVAFSSKKGTTRLLFARLVLPNHHFAVVASSASRASTTR
jgi:hypothetical protein